MTTDGQRTAGTVAATGAPIRRSTLLTLAVAGASGIAAERVEARRHRHSHHRGDLGPTGPNIPVTAEEMQLERVVAAAAQELRVDQQEVVVLLATGCWWSSSALGCPVPGGVYAAAMIPGYRVVVEGPDGTRIDYRGSVFLGRNRFGVCEQTQQAIAVPDCPPFVCTRQSCVIPACAPDGSLESHLSFCPRGW